MQRIFRAIGAKIIRFLTQTYAMSTYMAKTILQLRYAYFYRKQITSQSGCINLQIASTGCC